jgi:hypothetical protein
MGRPLPELLHPALPRRSNNRWERMALAHRRRLGAGVAARAMRASVHNGGRPPRSTAGTKAGGAVARPVFDAVRQPRESGPAGMPVLHPGVDHPFVY